LQLNSLSFDLLSQFPEIAHASFTRHGNFDVSDHSEHVHANCAQIQKLLGISHLIQSKQCHGADIYIVDDPLAKVPACDALITTHADIGLMIKHADCQAALFYDPINKVIAAAHAGWRGSVAQIYTKTIDILKTQFGSSPENILVCISPSLGPENAEFKNYKIELPEAFWQYQVKPNYFDFWAISQNELMQAGVLSHHIQMAKCCTYNNSDDYFSYRRDKTTGRHGTVIAMKKS
jgi:YfiH family protein